MKQKFRQTASALMASLMVAGSERPVQVRVVYTLIKPNGEQ